MYRASFNNQFYYINYAFVGYNKNKNEHNTFFHASFLRD